MRRMERSLVLNQVDVAWKNHLLAMDHLRSGIGLVSYAQIDAKTEYKRVGMKEFDNLWKSERQDHRHRLPHGGRRGAGRGVGLRHRQMIHEAAPRLQAPPPSSGIQANSKPPSTAARPTRSKSRSATATRK